MLAPPILSMLSTSFHSFAIGTASSTKRSSRASPRVIMVTRARQSESVLALEPEMIPVADYTCLQVLDEDTGMRGEGRDMRSVSFSFSLVV